MHFYVFIRTDIPLADQMCQVAHAAALAGKWFQLPNNCNLVLLQVKDKPSLLAAADRLAETGIKFAVNLEPDDDMGETAIATQSIGAEQRKALSSYPLWRPAQAA